VEGDFRVGEWLVSPKLNTVHCDGRSVRIEPKMMQVLVCLANRPGEVLSKEELIQTVWKDTFVTDEVLTRAISELRRIFLDDAKQPHMIETVAKSGYRIIAPVQPLIVEEVPRTRVSHKLVLVLVLMVLTGSILAFVLYDRSSRREAAAARVRSIAVLPLTNLSHDPEQEYFADGMTEALINDLCKIGALRVISRTSVMQYKATRKPLPEIARELKVDSIVEGSVQRSGDRVRISAQLIDGKTDAHLWARSFDRDLSDVLMLESEVAQAVVGEIRVELTPADVARVPSAHVVSRKAHDAYLRGRFAWSSRRTKRDLEQSISFYRQAIDEDPQYALAYAGMADSYAVLEDNGEMSASEANPRIKVAAMKAVEADPTLAEAHMMLADVKENEWDWAGAEQEYKHAIELNPGLARAHHWYAILLSALKRHDEAISEIERAVDLEPLTPKLYVNRSEVYYFAGRYDQALRTLNDSPTLTETDPAVRLLSAKMDLRTGNYGAAITKIRAVVDSELGDTNDLAHLGYAYALAGRRKEALGVLDELHRLGKNEYVNPGSIAMIWVGLGDKDRALTLLDEDYRLHSSFLMYLASDPVFEPLRSDSRFQDLLRRIGLPSN
jgi:TolB-like protein/DNA-binding winged helix-turn-helix (wHTH) protein/tetratricopeptide (TPR) repeat protein